MRFIGKVFLKEVIPLNNRDKKLMLQQYGNTKNEILNIEDEIAKWKTMEEKITQVYSSVANNKTDTRKMERAIIKIHSLSEKWMARSLELATLSEKIQEAIQDVPDQRLRRILMLRYIHGYTFEQIAVDLHYSYMQICRLHGKALDLIRL